MARPVSLRVVASYNEREELTRNKLITTFDWGALRALHTMVFYDNAAVTAILSNIECANFTNGIMIHVSDSEAAEGVQVCDSSSWVPAIRLITRHMSAWGFCVVGTDDSFMPFVYDIFRDAQSIGFAIDPLTRETEYFIILKDMDGGGRQGLIPASLTGGGGTTRRDGETDMAIYYRRAFVVESSRPTCSGLPTVPLASLLPLQSFKDLLMGAYAVATVRNAMPAVATEEKERPGVTLDPYGATDMVAMGDGVGVARDMQSVYDSSIMARDAFTASTGVRNAHGALLGTRMAGDDGSGFLRTTPGTGMSIFRADPEALALTNNHIAIPAGRSLVTGIQAAQAPATMAEIMKLLAQNASHVLGVPESVLGSSDGTNNTQYAVMNVYFTTLRMHRNVALAVVKALAWDAFGDEVSTVMKRHALEKQAKRGAPKRQRKRARAVRAEGEEGGEAHREDQVDWSAIDITAWDIRVTMSGSLNAAMITQLYNNGFLDHGQATHMFSEYFNLRDDEFARQHMDPSTGMSVADFIARTEAREDEVFRMQTQAAAEAAAAAAANAAASGGVGGKGAKAGKGTAPKHAASNKRAAGKVYVPPSMHGNVQHQTIGVGKTFKPPVVRVDLRNFMAEEAGGLHHKSG